jgi:outer membrane protein OmpA-like peptidoglycan-associated protein
MCSVRNQAIRRRTVVRHRIAIKIKLSTTKTPNLIPRDPRTRILRKSCPEARVEEGQLTIIEQVKFKTDSAVILPESDTVLSAVAVILTDHPKITLRSIEGHTDNHGQRQHNQVLSQNRAAAVVE